MRLSDRTNDIEETKAFANWLLDIREGNVGGFKGGEAIINIPDDLLITDTSNAIGSLIAFFHPSIIEKAKHPMFF